MSHCAPLRWSITERSLREFSGEHRGQLASVTGRVSYSLALWGPARAKLYLGTGGRWIDFQDGQTVPNHIHMSSGPLLTGGLSISF